MALTTYPLKFNTTEIPYPKNLDFRWERKKTTYSTESGVETDIILAPNAKLVLGYSIRCLDTWLTIFNQFASVYSFTLSYYDLNQAAYVTKTVRMEDYDYKLVKDSESLSATNGIYDVSFTLREF